MLLKQFGCPGQIEIGKGNFAKPKPEKSGFGKVTL